MANDRNVKQMFTAHKTSNCFNTLQSPRKHIQYKIKTTENDLIKFAFVNMQHTQPHVRLWYVRAGFQLTEKCSLVMYYTSASNKTIGTFSTFDGFDNRINVPVKHSLQGIYEPRENEV